MIRSHRKFGRLVVALLLGLVSVARTSSAAQTLQGFTSIVIGDHPSQVEKAAAEELSHYLGEIEGHPLPIESVAAHSLSRSSGLSFFLGDEAAALALGTKPAPWKTEEHLLKTIPGGLVLAGHDGDGGKNSSSPIATGPAPTRASMPLPTTPKSASGTPK